MACPYVFLARAFLETKAKHVSRAKRGMLRPYAFFEERGHGVGTAHTSRPIGPFNGTPNDQAGYLQALHEQIGERLAFWVYLLLSDFDPDEYSAVMRDQGRDEADIDMLGLFAAVGLRESDGTAKPALAVWDHFRER